MSHASNLADQALKDGKPQWTLNPNVSVNDKKNWSVGVSGGLGLKVWESENKNHSLGMGGTYGQTFGKQQDRTFQTKPNVGFGMAYRYKF